MSSSWHSRPPASFSGDHHSRLPLSPAAVALSWLIALAGGCVFVLLALAPCWFGGAR